MRDTHELKSLPDDELLRRLAQLLQTSRCTEADLVAHIGEFDARRLFAREASPSMFAYCTERLHLSEAEAYLRIAAARAAREHPALLEMLADGRLHLTAIAKLASHLTPENREALLERATHRTKREIEELVAAVAPRPDAATVMRRLPERQVANPSAATPAGVPLPQPQLRPDAVAAAGAHDTPDGPAHADIGLRLVEGLTHRRAVVEPLAPGRYRVQFTASAELRDKLERLRGLMRPSVPDGDLAKIIEQAVTEKLERLESRRFGRTKTPGKALSTRNAPASGRQLARTDPEGAPAAGQGSPAAGQGPAVNQGSPAARDSLNRTRYIPAVIKRAVYERDDGRCRYVDNQGRRCTARDRLEFHHRHPFGHGGDHSVEGLSLLCTAHNRYLAEIDYGREAMARHRHSKTESRSLGLRT